MRIRSAHPEDAAGIRAVNISAFGTRAEADLVEVLCERASPIISLVADDDGAIAGHILFTPMTLDADRELTVMGLAPMAVATGRQRQGIGTALVHAGLDDCWQWVRPLSRCLDTRTITHDLGLYLRRRLG